MDVSYMLPHKVGDDTYLGKVRKVKSTTTIYIPREAVDDLKIVAGDILNCHVKDVETGMTEDISVITKNNNAPVDKELWPIYLEVVKTDMLERGMRVYFRVVPLDILQWFDSLEESGLMWNGRNVQRCD